MSQEDITTNQASQRWFIDLDWYQKNNRSFVSIARKYLCPECRERLREESSAAELLTAIKDCCSQVPDFINGQLSILDSIFRLFLVNGNQPLDLEELRRQLSERRGDNPISAKTLSRLLNSDRYYGLRLVAATQK
jgi:hypothetical protein